MAERRELIEKGISETGRIAGIVGGEVKKTLLAPVKFAVRHPGVTAAALLVTTSLVNSSINMEESKRIAGADLWPSKPGYAESHEYASLRWEITTSRHRNEVIFDIAAIFATVPLVLADGALSNSSRRRPPSLPLSALA